MPCSLKVGTSGRVRARAAPDTASGRTLPALIWVSVIEDGDKKNCALLPSTAVIAGAPPGVGKWRNCSPPAALAKMAVGTCEAPYSPEELKMSWFGRFL